MTRFGTINLFTDGRITFNIKKGSMSNILLHLFHGMRG